MLLRVAEACRPEHLRRTVFIAFYLELAERSASSETEFLYDTFAAMLDGAELLAQAECSRLALEQVRE
ncbi:MAG: hypothetical protein V8T86_03200 [Victivallis sp.]